MEQHQTQTQPGLPLVRMFVVLFVALMLMFWGGFMVGQGKAEQVTAQNVKHLVHNNVHACMALGGTWGYTGDENMTMCILDGCTTPP